MTTEERVPGLMQALEDSVKAARVESRAKRTARERARNAAHVAADTTGNGSHLDSGIGADAASDVWEPLLREALEGLECSEPHYPQREHDDTVRRIRAALGDAP